MANHVSEVYVIWDLVLEMRVSFQLVVLRLVTFSLYICCNVIWDYGLCNLTVYMLLLVHEKFCTPRVTEAFSTNIMYYAVMLVSVDCFVLNLR